MTSTNPYQPPTIEPRNPKTKASGSFVSYLIAISAIWIAFLAIGLTSAFGSDFRFLASVLSGATTGIIGHRIALLFSRFFADILVLIVPVFIVTFATIDSASMPSAEPGLVVIAWVFLWIETMVPVVAIVGAAKLIQKIQSRVRCN